MVYVDERTAEVRAIDKIFKRKEFGWNTLHLGGDGALYEKEARSEKLPPSFLVEEFHFD